MNSTKERIRQGVTPLDGVREWTETDEDLLLAYRNRGDRHAFEQLVHRYERELYNYLRHYLGDAQMAEDAFQTTFLQVHLKCDTFEPGRRVRPWLYTIATHQAIDNQRKHRRHKMVSLDRRINGDGEDDVAALIQLLDSGEADSLDKLESTENSEAVREAVDALPDPLRQAVMLVYFQGMKYREAADVLEIPVGTVKSRLHSAIHKLTEAILPASPPGNE
ncbi:MAG: RNA polymerase sigma factor [Pirellulales bacterium]|nr:RNA polymerase sigma factor [Pirellulales bacterium]